MDIHVPGRGRLTITWIVSDFNGTLAFEGRLKESTRARLKEVAARGLAVYVLTADTFGYVTEEISGLPVEVKILTGEATAAAKAAFVRELGRECVAALGNGRNDEAMLREAGLSMAILGREGSYPPTLAAADVVMPDIDDALDLLLFPKRLVATLRG